MPQPRFALAPLTIAVALSLSAGAALAQPVAPAQAEATLNISLPSQPLGTALNELARQASLQLLVRRELVEGRMAPAVSGSLTARQALERLLAGSGLVAVTEGNAVVVKLAPPEQGSEAVLPAVTVRAGAERETATGPVIGYRAERSATATRTDTPIIETPQAISVVPRELLEDRNARSLGDALDMVAGISRRENYYFADDPYLRGFYTDPNSGYYRDGYRYVNAVAIDTDLLERVEVIKGPASVLYGALEPGGLINLVSKRPLAEPLLYLKQELGSWKDAKTTLDWSTPFEGGGGIRIPLTYRQNESFRDEVEGRSWQIAPVVEWKLAPRTTLALKGFFTNQRRTNDNVKIPLLDGVPVDIPISRFLGEPGNQERARFGSATASLEHGLSDALTYRGSLTRYDSHEATDRIVSFFGFEPDRRTLTRFAGYGSNDFQTWATQHELLWNTRWAGIQHRWLFGLDAFTQKEQRPAIFGSVPSIDVFNPVYDNTFTAFTARPAQGSTRDRLLGLYLQDQLTLMEGQPLAHKLELLLGLRADRSKQSFDIEDPFSLAPNAGSATKSALSPRVALLWMPAPTWSIYTSFAQSFNPQLVTTQSQELAEPQKGRQFEVGAKVELRRGLSATASVFDLRKTNVPTASPLGPSFPSQLSGEETSRGLEIELSGELAPGWQLAAAYTYLDAFVSKSNNGDEGNRIGGAARNTLNAWLSYTTPSGWGGGIGVSHVSHVYATNAQTIGVPAYTVADAGLWYRPNGSLGKGISLGASVKNLFDKRYFLTANGFGTSVSPGTPRSVVLSLGYGF